MGLCARVKNTMGGRPGSAFLSACSSAAQMFNASTFFPSTEYGNARDARGDRCRSHPTCEVALTNTSPSSSPNVRVSSAATSVMNVRPFCFERAPPPRDRFDVARRWRPLSAARASTVSPRAMMASTTARSLSSRLATAYFLGPSRSSMLPSGVSDTLTVAAAVFPSFSSNCWSVRSLPTCFASFGVMALT